MDWKKLGQEIIEVGAPIVGGVIGGPGGAAIGGLVARLFGADPENPADIALKIKADPDALVKLRQFEMEHERELIKLYLGDVQNARQREVDVTRATGETNWPIYVLAGIIVSGFFILVGILFKYTIPDGSREVAYMLFGSLSAGFGAVLQYFFGSSKGSADKTALLSK